MIVPRIAATVPKALWACVAVIVPIFVKSPRVRLTHSVLSGFDTRSSVVPSSRHVITIRPSCRVSCSLCRAICSGSCCIGHRHQKDLPNISRLVYMTFYPVRYGWYICHHLIRSSQVVCQVKKEKKHDGCSNSRSSQKTDRGDGRHPLRDRGIRPE